MNPRNALRALSTVGIGGVPSRELAFAFDIPTLPELVTRGETLRGAQPSEWKWFVDSLRSPIAKVQVPGPTSGLRDAREQAVFYVRELARRDISAVVFIDEPMLDVDAVLPLRDAIRDAGGIVGLHCCGNADWPRVLDANFDIVSFDVQLSLNALLEDWTRFVNSGAWLSLGIIPTDGSEFVMPELPSSILERSLLSPACGLGLFSDSEAVKVVAELHAAQSKLRAAAQV